MGSKAILEDVITMLLWSGSMMISRRWDRFIEPFEAWERRHGLHLQLLRMQQRALIEKETVAGKIVYSLTDTGRLEAVGGRDVEARWNRHWDGKWRQLLFDLPVNHKKARVQLWRWLRHNHFGYLQQSVWVHPDPMTEMASALKQFHTDVEMAIVMEAQCAAGYANESIALGGWDFDEINMRYKVYIEHFQLTESVLNKLVRSSDDLGDWLRREKVAWRHALALDPLLPAVLCPKNYAGRAAWTHRVGLHQRIAHAVLR